MKDTYANLAYLTCTESAANTLTFAKLDVATGALLGEKKYAMLIHRAEFFASSPNFWANFNSSGDRTTVALTVSNGIVGLSVAYAEVVTSFIVERLDYGAAASSMIIESPFIKDFSSFPGGGILVPADKLFLAVSSIGAAAAQTVGCRIFYTMKELKTEEYWDLVESRRMLS